MSRSWKLPRWLKIAIGIVLIPVYFVAAILFTLACCVEWLLYKVGLCDTCLFEDV